MGIQVDGHEYDPRSHRRRRCNGRCERRVRSEAPAALFGVNHNRLSAVACLPVAFVELTLLKGFHLDL